MKLEPVKKPYGMMNEMRCYYKEEKIHIKDMWSHTLPLQTISSLKYEQQLKRVEKPRCHQER